MIVTGGDVEESVGTEPDASPAVRPGSANGVGDVLERDVGDDVGAAASAGVAVVDHEADDTIGARRRRDVRQHVHVQRPVGRERRIERDAMHAALSHANQVRREERRTARAEQARDRSVGVPHREPSALLGEEHRAVRRDRDVPRTAQRRKYHRPCQHGIVGRRAGARPARTGPTATAAARSEQRCRRQNAEHRPSNRERHDILRKKRASLCQRGREAFTAPKAAGNRSQNPDRGVTTTPAKVIPSSVHPRPRGNVWPATRSIQSAR